MAELSEIQILYEETNNAGDWMDISRRALISGATFDAASNANPGTCEIVLRDPDRDMSNIVTGHRVRLFVDGQPLWSGFALIKGRSNFLPTGDGRFLTKARRWTINGTDNNTLLDRRVFRNPGNYLSHIPYIETDRYDGWIIRNGLALYTDMPTADPWLDISTEIDDVAIPASYIGPGETSAHISRKWPWEYPQQGAKVRDMFNDASVISSGVFYIGPDDAVHYHAFQNREAPWGFSDRPNHAPLIVPGQPGYVAGFQGTYTGFREIEASEDGSQLGTDALVWGGSPFAGNGRTSFHRATDAVLEARHGKWQWPETHFDEQYFKTDEGVAIRAHMIVYGIPGHPADPSDPGAAPGSVVGEGPRGMRFPGWSISFTWHTTDVPLQGGARRHIYPGDIVPIQLWTFSEDEGATPFLKYLPLRSLSISFPTGAQDGTALVQFRGTFDLGNNDPKFLWKWLRGRERRLRAAQPITVVTSDSTTAPLGGLGAFVPAPSPPDGTSTIYTLPFGYIGQTTIVTKNGLEQRFGFDYLESDPEGGEITFTSVPRVTDRLFVRCRTLLG